jgi:hypothetical protein
MRRLHAKVPVQARSENLRYVPASRVCAPAQSQELRHLFACDALRTQKASIELPYVHSEFFLQARSQKHELPPVRHDVMSPWSIRHALRHLQTEGALSTRLA